MEMKNEIHLGKWVCQLSFIAMGRNDMEVPSVGINTLYYTGIVALGADMHVYKTQFEIRILNDTTQPPSTKPSQLYVLKYCITIQSCVTRIPYLPWSTYTEIMCSFLCILLHVTRPKLSGEVCGRAVGGSPVRSCAGPVASLILN